MDTLITFNILLCPVSGQPLCHYYNSARATETVATRGHYLLMERKPKWKLFHFGCCMQGCVWTILNISVKKKMRFFSLP